jgi:hypothetical protein
MPFFSAFTGSFAYGRRASAFRRVWNPSTDITPAIWLDASDASSYTLVNTKTVNTITDKAGNATFIPNDVWGGGYGGTLNGLNTFMSVYSTSNIISSNEVAQADAQGNHWAIGVFYWNDINDSQDSLWSVENNTVSVTSKRDYAISAGNTSQFDGELDLDGLSSNRISSTIGNLQTFDSGITQYTWVIITAIFNKTGNQIAVRVDGANAFTPVNDYDNALNTNMDLRFFRNRANESMSGRLAEFFSVADVPGTGGTDISDVEAAEGYLAWKWGLTASLPLDHPYKTKGPATIANYNPGGGGGASFTWGGDRGIIAGGGTGGSNVIWYYDITANSSTSDFGDLTAAKRWLIGGCSNATRGVIMGGFTSIRINNMDYITIATPGNALDFGDLTSARDETAAASNGTYGLAAAGNAGGYTNTIDYITIATTGNATDFGDISQTIEGIAPASDATYILFAGGNGPLNNIEYVTADTPGNSQDFGDLNNQTDGATGLSDATRSVFAGGLGSPTYLNNIDYVTTATPGNATDFGDLTSARRFMSSASNGTVGVWAGGFDDSILKSTNKITIQTAANATSFGDISSGVWNSAGLAGNAS